MLSNNQNPFILAQQLGNQSDLVLNVQGLKTSPVTKDFEIKGEVWKDICPSNQCQIEEDGYSFYVVTPGRNNADLRIYLILDFYIRDNITNKDLTPLEKEFVEGYVLSFSCRGISINDIVEQGNNTINACSGEFTNLGKQNKEDIDISYYYIVEGAYNNQSDALNVTGEFDGVL